MIRRKSSANDKLKVKMKKNAFDYVDIEAEKRIDPKYKTELCTGWLINGLCVYGNRCRFAHGQQELVSKQVINAKYKEKQCKPFNENGYCLYGKRCTFKHEERTLKDIPRSFYLMKLLIREDDQVKEKEKGISSIKRLDVFDMITSYQAQASLIFSMPKANMKGNITGYSNFQQLPCRI